MKQGTELAIVAAVGLGAVYLIYKGAKATADTVSAAAASAGQAVNPTSDQNLAYRAANAVSSMGGDSRPLGVKLFEWLNPGTVKEENKIVGEVQPNRVNTPGAQIAEQSMNWGY